MKSQIHFLVVLLSAATTASAHFVFVVPEPGAEKAKVILSETLEADEDVDVKLIAKTDLAVRGADGAETKVLLGENSAGHAFSIPLPGDGQRVVHGKLVLGVQKRGEGKAFLLVYHPKTVLGDPFNSKTTLGEKAKAEIVANGKPGAVVFQALLDGKPAAGTKATVVLPDGKEKELTLDAQGRTEPLPGTGRFGVWARCVEAAAGESETRHYPTLVIDVSAAEAAQAQPAAANVTAAPEKADAALLKPVASKYPKLPEAASSFGAASADGWLYVYGGHIAPTHHYDTQAVSGKFHRLKLDGGTAWEPLEGGPGLQGMNLVAHGGKIYRVGGMRPLNKPGEKADNHSVADVARFDPAIGKWEPLPSLPEPRSSHDVVVLDDKLYALGGWNMKGAASGNTWPKAAVVLALSSANPQWTNVEQPFARRALIAAVHAGKIYVIGGFDEHDDPSLEVDVFDPARGTWAKGPALSGRSRNGFAPAACVFDDKLYVSVMDGSLLRLNEAANRWDVVAKTTPRIVHRLVPHGAEILVIGGADRGGNFDLVESVTPEQRRD
jgi:N-acetylneuraminic acid mutarotase